MVDNGRIMKELKELQEAAKTVYSISENLKLIVNLVTHPDRVGIDQRR